jgi:hypothetical protein
MKKLLFFILLAPLLSHAQNDTTKVTTTIQARDWEYIGIYIAHNQTFEDLFDSVKVKFRVASPPTGTTNVAVTATIGELLAVDQLLRRDPYAIGGSVWSRVNTALGVVNNSYMNTRLTAQQNDDTNLFMNNRSIGRSKLTRQ